MKNQGWLTAGLLGTGVALLLVGMWAGERSLPESHPPRKCRAAGRSASRHGAAASCHFAHSRRNRRTEGVPFPTLMGMFA
jgi:hypothetical protein